MGGRADLPGGDRAVERKKQTEGWELMVSSHGVPLGRWKWLFTQAFDGSDSEWEQSSSSVVIQPSDLKPGLPVGLLLSHVTPKLVTLSHLNSHTH
jgi:hypothetical protein